MAKQTARFSRRSLRLIQTLPVVVLTLALTLGAGQVWTVRAERSGAYGAAAAALAGGDLVTARDGFADLGDYRDAAQRLAQVNVALAPYESAYEEARTAVAEGRFDDAIARLVTVVRDLPSYEPATMLLDDARAQRRENLLNDATRAEQDGDWLAVERALTAVAADDPTDTEIAARLAGVRRDHAPLVYARDGVVYVAGPDGGDERAVSPPMDATWPTWNPERTQIAFIQRHPGGAALDGTLQVVNLDGSNPRAMAERAMPFYWPSWSPDGTKIAFVSASDFDEERNEGKITLHIVDLDTGVESDVTGDRLPHAFSPSWSPDGAKIAFVSDRLQRRRDGSLRAVDGEVYLLDVATGALTDVSQGRMIDEAWISWSPAGDELLIFTIPDNWNNPRQSQIFLLDPVTTDLVEIPTHAWELSLPVWSPDGDRFAYVEGDNVVRIWSEAGEDWVRVETDLAPFLSWSPDGSALVAASSDSRTPSYIIPVDDQFGARTPIDIGYDSSRGTGPPQWTPRTLPLAPPSTSLTGTALDA
ncbi:MAG TPA: hypothetical protein VKB09_12635 [Thermomicrobiales bacterium]|nr:hypothetical protein [Thermomicrobiales bacterium]